MTDQPHIKQEQSLPEPLQEVMDKLPEDKRQQLMLQINTMSYINIGFPPPELVKMFEELSPGAAKEILEMTKREQTHRIDFVSLEQQCYIEMAKGKRSITFLTAFLGFLSLIMILGAALFAAKSGFNYLSYGIIGVGVSSVVGHFLKEKL